MKTAKEQNVNRGIFQCELYHLTSKEKLQAILSEGIKPGNGANSILAENLKQPAVSLCKAADVPKWQVLLNADAIVRVSPLVWDELFAIDSRAPKAKTINYYDCEEIRCACRIPPEYLEKALLVKQTRLDQVHHDLALGYTFSLSLLCAQILNMEYAMMSEGCEIPNKDIRELTDTVNGLTGICARIDFTKASGNEYAKLLTEDSLENCAYTFADYYFNEGRCFEHLAKITGPLETAAKQLYECIVKNYPKEALYVEKIGGYSK